MRDVAFTVWIPTAVAILTLVASHQLSAWREREGKRREQRIVFLLGAFRALCRANHHPRLYEIADEVQQAVADIQALGTPDQIKLAQDLARDLASEGSADLDPLLLSLRRELRRELGRESYGGRVVWLRVEERGKNACRPPTEGSWDGTRAADRSDNG
jgi:hypothetical protein